MATFVSGMGSRARTLGCSAALVAAVALPAPAHAAARAGCSARNSKTVVSSNDARVYSVKGSKKGFAGRQFVGCLRRSERRTSLIFVAKEPCVFEDTFKPSALAGPFVAYGYTYSSCGGDSPYARVTVTDLRTGKDLFAGDAGKDTDFTMTSAVTAIQLLSDGAMGWIARVDSGSSPTYEVWANDASGRRLLDGGTDVDPASLRLAPPGLTWTRGGQAKSAPLS